MPYYLLINQLRRVQAISANCKQASGLACPVNAGHLQSISEPITTGCTRLVHQVDLDSEAAFASPADAASPFASAGFPFSADCDDRIESGCWTDLVGAWCIRKRTRAPPMTRNTNDSHRRVGMFAFISPIWLVRPGRHRSSTLDIALPWVLLQGPSQCASHIPPTSPFHTWGTEPFDTFCFSYSCG